ncbi:sugar transferase [Celeribacter sp.]|uniref:sugar transferase n=1 Tax=Celeribacter sp. TaxID=1890673 RepID=UPI003A95C47A
MKRAIDIALAATALIFVSPILMIAAIGVRLSSKGPILYRAKRVGKGGVPFDMLKFRTMHVGTRGPVITAQGDARIFPFGAFLRKSKIDELPQFWNVLMGDISVVGPRPEDPAIVADHYSDWMMETLAVRPGITSPGAIYYYLCGEALIDPKAPEKSYVEHLLPAKLAVDRAYLKRANVASDLVVVLHTALAIIGPAIGLKARPLARDIAAAERWAPATFGAAE